MGIALASPWWMRAPWQYDGMWGVRDAEGRCVADHEMYEYKEPPPESEDDEAWGEEQREIEVNTLRLIAKAPELLDTLLWLRTLIGREQTAPENIARYLHMEDLLASLTAEEDA